MIVNMNYAAVLYFRGDIERAERYAWKAVETDPGMPGARYWLGLIYQQQNKMEEAMAEFELGRKLDGDRFSGLDGIGHAYAVVGRRKDALKVIDDLKEAIRQGEPVQWPIATIYAELGDMDQAFAWLEKQNKNWRRGLYGIRFDPRFSKLRQDPRYKEFLKRKFQISA
jgi:tetratricopeptide (TPR) repeat protein